MSDLYARTRAVIPSWVGVNYSEPIEIVSGKGCRVTDGDGHSYLDFFAGILTNMLGYDVAEAESGRVVVTLAPDDSHLNPAGTVHGGLAATLLDSAMGLAIWSTLENGVSQTTLEFKISLIRPILPGMGTIKAEGVVLNRGRRIGTAEGRIVDDRGRLLAHGTTTCLIFEATA